MLKGSQTLDLDDKIRVHCIHYSHLLSTGNIIYFHNTIIQFESKK
jgi:hypothetical protein